MTVNAVMPGDLGVGRAAGNEQPSPVVVAPPYRSR